MSDRVTYHESPVLAIAVLLGSLLISTMGIGFVVPFLPVIATDLGATGFAVGVVMAVFSLSMGVSQPFVGSISDRYGRKPFLVVGLIIYSACANKRHIRIYNRLSTNALVRLGFNSSLRPSI